MIDLRTAAQQALEALEFFKATAICQADTDAAIEAITALKAALAEPQEPVAWLYRDHNGELRLNCIKPTPYFAFPVYTAPPQRKPLTEEEIETISSVIERSDFFDCVVPFARAIERAHGIGGSNE